MEEYLSEKEQWEQVTRWLRENGLWIIAGIVVGAAGLGGWHWYQDHLDSVGAAASAKYTELVQDFGKSDRTAGFVAVGELERDFPSSPYVDQAKLMAARIYVDDGALDKAAGELQSVVEHSKDSELQMLARLRERLAHDFDTERAVARAQLLQITVQRARKLVAGGPA